MGDFALAIDAWVTKTGDKAEKIVAHSITEFSARVVVRSPVDTGFFRSNWRIGLGPSPTGPVEAFAIAPGPLGSTYYLVNATAYGRRLEHGFTGTDSLGRHYNQPGRGFVGITVVEWPEIVREQALAVGVA